MSDSFTAPVRLSDLGPEGVTLHLKAASVPRTAIARRLDVPEVIDLSGDIAIRPEADGASVQGVVRARLVRTCVVTLDPLEEVIDEAFSLRFTRGLPSDDVELALEDEWSEPLPDDMLDAAEILVQQVAIAMDPYPRKPGAQMPQSYSPRPEDFSPFTALKALKKPQGD